MAQKTELEVTLREVMGKKNKLLLKAGLIPGNISGHKEASQAVQLDAIMFDRLRRSHATRSILTLRIPNAAPQTVLVRHVQHDPLTGKIIHVDFSRVSMTERIEMKVSLHFVGESPAVKNKGGVLLHLMEGIDVACLVSDIVDYIDVDVSSLAEIDVALHASDVKLPANYTLISDPEEPIAKVAATRAESAEQATGVTATSAASPSA
jgi:large subunit ribosomal protein L25